MIRGCYYLPQPQYRTIHSRSKLYKKQTFAIYVYDAKSVERARAVFSETDYGLNYFSLPNLVPGTYIVKVVAEFDSKSKIFMVTQ